MKSKINIPRIFSFFLLAILTLATSISFAAYTISSIDDAGSGTGTQVPDYTVTAGTVKLPLYGFGFFNITGGPVTFNGLSFTTTGTYVAGDIVNFKLWDMPFGWFNPASGTCLSTITTGLGTGNHTFPAFSTSVPIGSFRCFYVSMDLAAGAVDGHTVKVSQITNAQISSSAGENYGTNLAGGVQTIAGSVQPIELKSFSGKNTGNEIFLEWTTASEVNNDFFTVERSINATNFDFLGTVKAIGNSSSPHAYTYLDSFSPASYTNYYYRLKQTDFNGGFGYSNIISVSIPNNSQLLNAYFDSPTDKLNVETYFPEEGEFLFTILDISGHTIYKQIENGIKGNNVFPISLNTASSGIYFIKISGNNVLLQSKFIKN